MELRLALRRVFRRPFVFSGVVGAIALAVATNTALFSVIDGRLFRPLPFLDPDRLVAVDYRSRDGRLPDLAYVPTLVDLRVALREGVERSPLVSTSAQAGSATFFDRNEARDLGLEVQGVDSQFFPLLGLSAHLGATFSLEDERTAAALSRDASDALPVVIGHDLWRRLYGGDPKVLGDHQLAGRHVRIIGVMASGVKFPGETNVWAPVPSTRAIPPAYVRLAPGATVRQLSRVFPDLEFRPLREAMHPGEGLALLVLFAAAVSLLVVAWVQVAALMFSGALGQLQDIGVRMALGAGRLHLVRQFAIDAALTSGVAFVFAWLAVPPLTDFIVSTLPLELRHGQYLSPDVRAFRFGCAVCLLGLSLLTTAPLLMAGRAAPLALLSGRFAATPFRTERLRRAILVAQMTLTALLLYLAGLAAHSYMRAASFDYGFDVEHVLVFTPPPWATLDTSPKQSFAAFAERNRKVQSSVEVLQGLSYVTGVASFHSAPLGVGMRQDLLPISSFDGLPRLDVEARVNYVGVDFVRAFGATIVAGRGFDDTQEAGGDDVAVVTETLARRLKPPVKMMGEELSPSVVGREIQAGPLRARIIGVVKDLVDTKPGVPAAPQFFLPNRSPGGYALAIRTSTSIQVALPVIRTALEPVWGQLSPRQFTLMGDELQAVLVPLRGQSVLLGLIAACCVPIAAIGLAGSLMHSVRVRTREIAIRIAIGAEPAAVRWAVVRGALATVGVGILLGTALGAGTGSVIAHQLFEVEPIDASTVIAVAVGLMTLAWLMAFVPARAASRVEPARALRQM